MSAPAAANSPPAKGKCREAARGLVPKLRFPEFSRDSGWDCATVADLVDIVAPPKKLPSSTYLPDGRFPIIDQSRSYICGWTNNNEAVITTPLPVVVFGDHTCVLKFVDHPFAQGADGIKIVTANRCVSTPYLYHQLSHRPLVAKQYKRHFSTLKNRLVYFPDPKLGEQRKIADCLGSLDDLIAAEGRKLEALRQHKKGLMQQLFPQPGETAPRLRFPEFVGQPLHHVRLRDLTEQSTARNGKKLSLEAVMGVNKEHGIVPMKKRLVAADISRYKLVRSNWFAYNPMRLNIGSIARYQGNGNILVSPDYVVFRCLERSMPTGLLPEYLDSFRSCWQWHVFVNEAGDGGVRVRIYYRDLAQLQLALPSIAEQRKIAECLGSLDALIAAGGRKLEALRQHKRGLMQQLFPNPKEGHA
ncbi:MAG: hypothetical protein OXF03_03825 [Gammaproteobacteria bacterium]|nr:hypothetical protein [Gammaproteobacteria bacterium]